jgi:hypothetical protein
VADGSTDTGVADGSTDTGVADGSTDTGVAEGSTDTGVADGSTDTGVADGSTGDSGTSDAAIGDTSAGDGSHEAGLNPSPLQMCEALDAIFGAVPDGGEPEICATETSSACPDRADDWVGPIIQEFGNCPGTTAPANGPSDCRVFEIFNTQDNGGLLTLAELTDWSNTVLPAFVLAFFGCPATGADAGPLAYGLLPTALAGDVFTTADLNLISYYFSWSVQQAVSDYGIGPSLDSDQTAAIEARLAYLQTTASPINSTQYSHAETCTDAGIDAAVDAGVDGGGD